MLVDYEKLPPSHTKGHQAADVASTFADVKVGDKVLAKSGKDTSNPVLENNLKLYFAAFEEEFPGCSPSHDVKSKVITGLARLNFVMKEKYFTADKMRMGFVRTGQHVKSADHLKEESTVDKIDYPHPFMHSPCYLEI